jgi:hypothetical protein
MSIGQRLYSKKFGWLTLIRKAYDPVTNSVVWLGMDRKGIERKLDGSETSDAPTETDAHEDKVDLEAIARAIRLKKGDKGDPGKDGRDGKDGKDGKPGKDGYTPVKGVDYFDGRDGKDGKDGKDGRDGKSVVGPQGPKGEKGDKGDDGLSAFELAAKNGFKGTEEEWLASLKGKDGLNGLNGGGGGIHKIEDATDVSVRGAENNQVLSWDSSLRKWIPKTVAGVSGSVDSVNGMTGVVVLDQDDIGDGTTYKQYSETEKTKLAGIESNADVTDAGNVGSSIHGATAKTTPVDADTLALIDSAASNVLKKLTWANVKATLKTYFDTLYNLYVHPNHTGDVTSSGDGAQTIAADAVTNAKLANMATQTIKGRTTAGTGDPEDLTAAQVRTILNVADGATAYTDEMAQDAVGAMIADTATIDLTYTDATPELKADVKDGSITYAKIQNVSATDKLLGRSTAGAGSVEEIACTAAGRSMIGAANAAAQTALLDAVVGDSGSGGTKGLVPAPAAGDSGKFLKGDGTWAIASGSGISRTVVVTSGSSTMGSSSSTDYVYFVVGAHTMSLPAASGNTNRYTVKNNHSANITIDTAGVETVEGAASISIAPEESVDLMSDGTNWYVI